MTDKIKIIKDFFSPEECAQLIDSFEHFYSSKDPDLVQDQHSPPTRNVLSFGKDRIPGFKVNLTLDPLKDRRPFFKTIFERVISTTKDAFGDTDEIYFNQVWFSKHLAGGDVASHDDTDGDMNTQFAYSAVGYLNTLENSGHIIFDEMGITHLPEAGDLVVFLSAGTGTHRVPPVNDVRYTMPMWLTKDIDWKLEL